MVISTRDKKRNFTSKNIVAGTQYTTSQERNTLYKCSNCGSDIEKTELPAKRRTGAGRSAADGGHGAAGAHEAAGRQAPRVRAVGERLVPGRPGPDADELVVARARAHGAAQVRLPRREQAGHETPVRGDSRAVAVGRCRISCRNYDSADSCGCGRQRRRQS